MKVPIAYNPQWIYVSVFVNAPLVYAAIALLYSAYYHEVNEYIKKLELHVKLKDLYEKARSLAYRDMFKIMFGDLGKIKKLEEIDVFIDRVMRGSYKPPEEFDEVINTYEDTLEKLYVLEEVIEEALKHGNRLKRVYPYFSLLIAGLLTAFFMVFSTDPYSMFVLTMFFSIFIGVMSIIPSPTYREHYKEYCNKLKKIFIEVKRGKEKIDYERWLEILTGEEHED